MISSLLKCVIALVSIAGVFANPTGPGGCTTASVAAMQGAVNTGYGLSFSSGTTYAPGSSVTVKVTHATVTDFRGFLIYATNAAGTRVGTFVATANLSQLGSINAADCPTPLSTTIAHTSPANKPMATTSFTWTAPAVGTGTVTFNAAIVAGGIKAYQIITSALTEGVVDPTTAAPTGVVPTTAGPTGVVPTTVVPTTKAPGAASSSFSVSFMVIFMNMIAAIAVIRRAF
jgi:hypothetical protein